MDRLQLQQLLESLEGVTKVYFQPPANPGMEYPCIVYERDSASTAFADNRPYRFEQRYLVTIIDPEPDSGLVEQVAQLPKTSYSRHFVADNLHHDVFTIFF
jgi:hypothetical protein